METNNLHAMNLPKVLVIDDETDQRRVLCRFLTASGFQAFSASTGGEAIALARTLLPDICLSDISMPGMDGITLLKSLRADPQTEHMPIRFITGLSAPGSVWEAAAQNLGAGRVYVKGCDYQKLVSDIREILKAHDPALSSGRFLRRGDLIVNTVDRKAWVAKTPLPRLPAQRFDLLCALLEGVTPANAPVLRAQIWPHSGDANVVDENIQRLRKDLSGFPNVEIRNTPAGYLLIWNSDVARA